MKTLRLTFAGYVLVACALSFVFSNYSLLRLQTSSETENRPVSNFIKLAVSIPGTVTVTQAKEYSLVLEGEKENISRITTEVSNNQLSLKVKGDAAKGKDNG